MPSRDDLVRELVGKWVEKADADLKAAETLFENEGELWAIVAFHCQQSAEKYIKAVLTSQQIEFGKTHDISVLLDRLGSGKIDLETVLQPAGDLTVYGVQARYPGDGPEIDEAEAARAVELARMVARSIKDELGVD